MNPLENKFHQEITKIATILKEELGYNPKRFLQLLSREGGVQAAKRVISKSGATYGFEILWENKRLGFSIEALVLSPEYHDLFSEMTEGYVVTN